MWFLGKRESVNAWKKVDFDGFRERGIEVQYLPNGTNAGYQLERTEGSAMRPNSR
jgi:hypothetical protein